MRKIFKKGKIRKTRLNSNGRSVSKIGKILAQNWKSDPMNSPKAFGELKIDIYIKKHYGNGESKNKFQLWRERSRL